MSVVVKRTSRTDAGRIAVEVGLLGEPTRQDPDGQEMIPDRAELVFTPTGVLAWAVLAGVAVWPHKPVDWRARASFRVGWGRSCPVEQAPDWVTDLAVQVWASQAGEVA